jgi:copper oxidase (laccase) domain-containing protein
MIHIHAVRLSGGTGHEHITRVRWKNPDTSKTGENTRAEMVDWIKNKNGAAYVCGGGHLARVLVVNAKPPYIRTHADGVWTDNLLALPRF